MLDATSEDSLQTPQIWTHLHITDVDLVPLLEEFLEIKKLELLIFLIYSPSVHNHFNSCLGSLTKEPTLTIDFFEIDKTQGELVDDCVPRSEGPPKCRKK